VRIDRPDDDDAPTVEHETRLAERDTPGAEPDSPGVDHGISADSDVDLVAYNADFRAKVAAEYEAAWDEAAPKFRAAWEEHERRYPHPERSEPSVQADGSWHGDGTLQLRPDQNFEVDRYCALSHEIGENVIRPAITRIEAQDSSRHLEGLDNYLKGADRLKEKVADALHPPSKLTIAEALSTVPDAVRFTFCYGGSSYADGVRADVERLKAQGFELVKLKNTWAKDQYKGVNSQWRERGSGVGFEVQFHTRASFEAKELSHKAYERLRGSVAQDEEREKLETFQNDVCSKVQIPQGAFDLENHPRGRSDG
jgi:hypothetical protein